MAKWQNDSMRKVTKNISVPKCLDDIATTEIIAQLVELESRGYYVKKDKPMDTTKIVTDEVVNEIILDMLVENMW